MINPAQRPLVPSVLSLIVTLGACGGDASSPDDSTIDSQTQAISTTDAAACARITRTRMANLSGQLGAVLSLVQAETADPNGSPDRVDAIYYQNVKTRLDGYRTRTDLRFADDAPGSVPTPATVQYLPYELGFAQQDLYTARYRSFVRVPRTRRIRTIGDRVSVIAQGLEALAQDAFNCHEGISGNPR